MFPDNPVSISEDDRFNRFPFSQRIAQVIASRNDSSSIVIGIYGAWGEGKTTVLNFVEASLQDNSDIICIRFNPWFFRDDETLLLSFFKTLADSLNKKLKTKKEEIAESITKFGGIFASVSLADPSGGARASGQFLEKIGGLFSQVDLEENKKRIERILEEENKRVVILIDDIDRLEKSEIHSVFKLVKLSANFKNVIYILAFDQDKVASSISEKYGSEDKVAGYDFLEKIIQVPLTLPPISSSSLLNFCFDCIDNVLKNVNLELTDEERKKLTNSFTKGLTTQIKTPRVALRYGSIISFSIPLVKGEVNIADFLLIEGVKIFYPKLYSSIQENRECFIGEILDQRGVRFQEARKKINDVIEQSISDLSQDSQIGVRKLLEELFPRAMRALKNEIWGFQKKWDQEKCIASPRYFKRYFMYGIPEDDISDQQLIVFLDKLEQEEVSNLIDSIKDITRYQYLQVNSFLTEIIKKIDELSVLASCNLALSLSQMGDYFAEPKETCSLKSPLGRSAILVSDLVQRIDTLDKKIEFCKEIIQSAEPISFAIKCFTWISFAKQDYSNKDSENIFNESTIESFAEIIINRIRKLARQDDTSSKIFQLLDFWSARSSKQETNSYLIKIFDKDTKEVVDFLKIYPTTFPPSGVFPYPDYEGVSSEVDYRFLYKKISSVVDANLLIEFLIKVYGGKLNSPEFIKQSSSKSREELIAYHFVKIHNGSMADSTE